MSDAGQAAKAVTHVAVFFVCSGGLLLFASAVWRPLTAGDEPWSQQDTQRLAELSEEAYALHEKFAAARLRGIEVPEEPIPLRRVRAELAEVRGSIRAAAAAPQRTAKRLAYFGMTLLVIGLAAITWAKRRSPSASDDASDQ